MGKENSESQVKGYAYGKKIKGSICPVEVIGSSGNRRGFVRDMSFTEFSGEVRFSG